ncbi:MAG: hypothetical protein KGL52_03920 [Rhodospirillales bacterium]|nr:hypothetical protein [Rhodospirillales bacterium]
MSRTFRHKVLGLLAIGLLGLLAMRSGAGLRQDRAASRPGPATAFVLWHSRALPWLGRLDAGRADAGTPPTPRMADAEPRWTVGHAVGVFLDPDHGTMDPALTARFAARGTARLAVVTADPKDLFCLTRLRPDEVYVPLAPRPVRPAGMPAAAEPTPPVST